jgi:phosphoribosylanthranilate isomerase
MPTEVKICGLSDEEGVDAALEAGAEFLGLNFFPPSPRYVSLERAAALAKRARGKAAIVAVTVDADDGLISAIAADLRPDLIQLHGKETPGRESHIRSTTGLRTMKVFGVATRADFASYADYATDRFLLDAKAPKDATRPGGLGIAFDWTILADFSPSVPWFLSGGLDPNNVAAALAGTHAPGVDVSSGVESAPGQKDPARIHAFIRAVRDHDRLAAANKERAA